MRIYMFCMSSCVAGSSGGGSSKERAARGKKMNQAHSSIFLNACCC